MPAISLPFVVALILLLLLFRLWRRPEAAPADRAAMIFVGMCAMLVTIVGLRWTFDLTVVRFVQPITASLLPPVAWACFAGLASREKPLWPHTLPIVFVTALAATWPLWHPPIDFVLAALFAGYGIALLRLAARGPDAFGASRLSDAGRAQNATRLVGLMLIGSSLVDLLVGIDFGINQGVDAARIVGVANLIALAIAAAAVAMAGQSRPARMADMPAEDPIQRGAEAADADIVAAIDHLMRERQLFRDPDLTLERLARRAGIPARQISAAINRVHGRNVSQVVNEYRIAEAKRLLAEADDPVTTIMFECGFQTKSNFNREFRRVAGMSPSDFRRAGSAAPAATLAEAPPPGMR